MFMCCGARSSMLAGVIVFVHEECTNTISGLAGKGVDKYRDIDDVTYIMSPVDIYLNC